MEKVIIKTDVNKLKKTKKFLAGVTDFLLAVVTAALLFVPSVTIYRNSKSCKENINQILDYEQQLADLCAGTRLTYYLDNSKKNLASTDDVNKSYLINQTYTSFIIHADSRASDDLFKDAKVIDENTDSLYYYIFSYRKINNSDFVTNSSLSTDYRTSYEKIGTYFISLDSVPLFTLETANSIFNVLKGKNPELKTYDAIKDTYTSLLEKSINDYIEFNRPYLTLNNQYVNLTNKYYRPYLVIVYICYFIAITILYLGVPLLLKENRTIFMKLFRLTSISIDNEKLGISATIINYFLHLLIMAFIPILLCLAMLDAQTFIAVIFMDFLKVFNMFTLSTLTILLFLCNMIFVLATKKRKQTIIEWIGKFYAVEDEKVKTVEINGKKYELN